MATKLVQFTNSSARRPQYPQQNSALKARVLCFLGSALRAEGDLQDWGQAPGHGGQLLEEDQGPGHSRGREEGYPL